MVQEGSMREAKRARLRQSWALTRGLVDRAFFVLRGKTPLHASRREAVKEVTQRADAATTRQQQPGRSQYAALATVANMLLETVLFCKQWQQQQF